ncbi:MAG: preprotein translocase subunit SecF [Candidatus Parcubacteria bacterium]|jgi:preprotein translocase subunit SecF|nr:preprotein translocase subunit SecF [Candidatus Parcubacteria bacterium]
MWIVNNRKIFYAFSGILVLVSLLSLSFWGLQPSIDFTGGTLIEVEYPAGRPDQAAVSKAIVAMDPSASVRPSGSDEYMIRLRPIDQTEKSAVMDALSMNAPIPSAGASTTAKDFEVKAFDSIGPVLGAEALRRAYVSILLVILGIVLFITFAFRKVSEPVSSWKYGLVAVIALIHDVIIPIGAFSVLGHFAGYEVDTLFVTALLVILGFSVHDTIVVFDRVRENLRLGTGKQTFAEIVGASISQTFTRSINTSLTTLIALVVLYILGGQATEHFSLALIIGIVSGTYSSVFIGSPLLVTIEKMRKV